MARRLGSERAATELGRILRPYGFALTHATTVRRLLSDAGMWAQRPRGSGSAAAMPVGPSDLAPFVLHLTCTHLRLHDIAPATRRVVDLVPREQAGAGGPLCARLAEMAGGSASFFVLPGRTLGQAVGWLIEQLARPEGTELTAALTDANFALRVEHYGGPFGPIATIALKDGSEEVTTLYVPASIDWHTPRASGIVPSATLGIDLIAEIAGLLREEEPMMAQAA